jgi:hypothetical protein
MAFNMGSVLKDPIDVRHFSLLYQFPLFIIGYIILRVVYLFEKERTYF